MATPTITILGGDLRQCCTGEYLHAAGWQVTCYHTPDFPYPSDVSLETSLTRALERSKLILAPTPLSKDGFRLFQSNSHCPDCLLETLWDSLQPGQILAVSQISGEVQNTLSEKDCSVFPFSQSPVFAAENALLTAEGLLSEVIRCTPFSLASANVLILGYGRCGSAIGRLLHPLCRSIYVLEQDFEKMTQAEKQGICPITEEDFSVLLPKCDILINTIPASVLEDDKLQKLHVSCHIFDIASSPFGFSADIREKYLLPYFRLPGLPGRFSPLTSGRSIGKILERITEYDF